MNIVIIVPDRHGGFLMPPTGAYDVRSFSMICMETVVSEMVANADAYLDV